MVSAAAPIVAVARRTVEIFGKIAAMITPTVYAQEADKLRSNISGETVTVNGRGAGFTLPAGRSITIVYRATVTNVTPPHLTQISNDGNLEWTNVGDIHTDDPNQAGGPQPTVTEIDSTTIVVTSSQNPSIAGQSVTFTATLTGSPVHATGDPAGTVESLRRHIDRLCGGRSRSGER